ncbi:hypothetical protein A3K80_06035 [Candidatus Bathyarchaeota archaeon RBG_13_38_9]|nr:MAG: hypothetical protein A3K80_06035 [Candidatus Bathyarchaeota archaeon RBG_13_38_9]
MAGVDHPLRGRRWMSNYDYPMRILARDDDSRISKYEFGRQGLQKRPEYGFTDLYWYEEIQERGKKPVDIYYGGSRGFKMA